MNMENYEIVQKNKATGEEKIFDNPYWGMSKETAEAGANVRRLIVPADKYDVFIRQKNQPEKIAAFETKF